MTAGTKRDPGRETLVHNIKARARADGASASKIPVKILEAVLLKYL